MYTKDIPIDNSESDLLNRADIAKNIASSIMAYSNNETLNIALCGPWGCGKTSLLNMIVSSIKSTLFHTDNSPIIINFNPWNFSNSDQLISQFFLMLANQLCTDKDKDLNKIGSFIYTYGSLITALSPVKVPDVSKGIGNFLKRKSAFGNDNISSQKENILNLLAKQNHRIIITIDDIDRLTFDEICLIFRLVSSVANFPKIVFLLVFDKNIVIKAVDKLQQDGERYLEKIIQVTIDVPPITRDQIANVFQNEILYKYEEIIAHYNDPDTTNYYYQMQIYIYDMLTNLRDIVRLNNALELKTSMIIREINIIDMIALTLIELKYHALYEWIIKSKSLLTGNPFSNPTSKSLSDDVVKEITSVLPSSIDVGIKNEIIKMLCCMFPLLNKVINASNIYINSNLLVRQQRIGARDYFDRYFLLNIGNHELSRQDIDSALFSLDNDDLIKFIKDVVANEQIESLIKEINVASTEINDDRKIQLIHALSCVLYTIDKQDSLLISSSKQRAKYLIINLLDSVSDTARNYDEICKLIDISDVFILEAVSAILHEEALAFGTIPTENPDAHKKFLSEDEYNDLCNKYVDKALEIDHEHNLLNLARDNFSLRLIEYIDPNSYDIYIKEKVKNNIDALRFISEFVCEWTSSKGNFYTLEGVHMEDLYKYIDSQSVAKVIAQIPSEEILNSINNIQLERLAAYVLCNGKIDSEISEEACQKKIEEWKSQAISNQEIQK